MPDANTTTHATLAELRDKIAVAKAERRTAALDDDPSSDSGQALMRKLHWTNEVYRLSAEIVREQRRLIEGTQ